MRAEDRSKQFADVLKSEISRTEAGKDEFIAVSFLCSFFSFILSLFLVDLIIGPSHIPTYIPVFI